MVSVDTLAVEPRLTVAPVRPVAQLASPLPSVVPAPEERQQPRAARVRGARKPRAGVARAVDRNLKVAAKPPGAPLAVPRRVAH
jgi:hypothetical protein